MDEQGAVAIVGMSLRFPGAENTREFWNNLRTAKDSIVTLDEAEMRARGATSAELQNVNWVRRVSRLRDPDLFDANFFSFTSREAQLADPQLRVMLDVCHEGIEDSGHVLSGTRTGVYIGVADNDYWLDSLIYSHPQALGASLVNRVLIKKDYFATQISHKLNLLGPSVSISTACSTSLVAVHEAVAHLLMYDCDFALAGGCEIDRGLGYLYEEGGILSRDGYCRAFDAAANGTVFGSGCGVVVLRRYEDAVRDRDHIYAVILGAQINNDGREKAGFTAPSVSGQCEVIQGTIAAAGISADEITYVETHGTGTLVGDPIEIQALARAFGQTTTRRGFCAIGSVKTNIGHLSVAAGIAGLIKTSLALKHREIPPTLHFKEPNPGIDFANSPFYVNTQLQEWATGDKPRIAGISAFGVGGTNAHVIVREAASREASGPTRPFQLITLSAKSAEALKQLRRNLIRYLQQEPQASLADVAYTLQVGRAQFPFRGAVVCETHAEAAAIDDADWIDYSAETPEEIRTAFMFPGQGSQYAGMGADLYAGEPVFRQEVDRCAELLDDTLGLDIRCLLFPADDRRDQAQELLRETRYTQPGLFTISYATAKLLLHWGVTPNVFIGHSLGEYVAACLAGVFSLRDALRLVAMRGRLMHSAPAGAMLSVTASLAKIEPLVPADIDIAAVNSDEQCVVSGPSTELEQFAATLSKQGVRTQRLTTSHAFHSRMMDGILCEFTTVLREIKLSVPTVPFVSNITGKLITSDQAVDPEYWVDHLRSTVRFADGLKTISGLAGLLIEVGPGNVLATLARQANLKAVSCMRQSKVITHDLRFLLQNLGEMWIAGARIDWTAFQQQELRNRIPLPTYPYQRKRFWFEPASKAENGSLTRKAVHPLLGQRWSSASKSKVYENYLTIDNPDYLKDHRLTDAVIFPGAAYVEMALAAARLQFGDCSVRIDYIKFDRALMLSGNEPRHIQMIVHQREGAGSFEITSRSKPRKSESEGSWQLHSHGEFAALNASDPTRIDLKALQDRITKPVDTTTFYASESIKYGPTFRAIAGLWARETEAIARVELPAELHYLADDYSFHPVALDACFQAIGAFGGTLGRLVLPVGLVNLEIYQRIPKSFWVHMELIGCGAENLPTGATITIIDDAGVQIARIEQYQRKELSAEALEPPEPFEEQFFEVAWKEAEFLDTNQTVKDACRALIVTDDAAFGQQLAECLTERRAASCLVHDYLSEVNVMSSLRALLDKVSGPSKTKAEPNERIEIVMMRVSDREALVEDLCDVLLRVLQALGESFPTYSSRIAIVTKGSQSVLDETLSRMSRAAGAALWGMGSAVIKELPDLQCLRIDLDTATHFNASFIAQELDRKSDENLIAYRGLTRYVARLKHLQVIEKAPSAADSFKIGLSEFGTFDALRRQPLRRNVPGRQQVEVELFAAGLNFKETMIVLGLLDTGHANAGDVPMGFEGAGRVTQIGDGVATLAVGDDVIVWGNGCLSSHITLNEGNVIRMDAAKLTYEQAASLPTVFMTAYYALHTLAGIRKGDRVLIHAAAGGVGQAAVQLARAMGAEIYATASRGKWEFLSKQGIEHIYDSRSLEFADDVIRATGGQGVDIVINALTGPFIARSFDVLARNGRFIEIGKLNIWTTQRATEYRPDVKYRYFELGNGDAAGPKLLETLLSPVIDGIATGAFEPTPIRVFSLDEVVPAFRWLAAGRNIGKAVIRLRGARSMGSGNVPIDAGKQYLVTGGSGALGGHVAEWLVKNGARDIVLQSRRPPTEDVKQRVLELRRRGADVRVQSCDVGDRVQLGALLTTMPRLAGIFHCAGVLDDGVITRQSRERFESVLQPKVRGVQNLHELTLERQLDYFVCFSSTSALLDGAGQSNYAAANAYLDAFAFFRRGMGLPALSINWGGWAGSGMAAELAARKPGIASELIDKDEGIAALDELIAGKYVQAVFSRMRTRLSREAKVVPLYRDLGDSMSKAMSGDAQFEQLQLLLKAGHDPAPNIANFLRREIGKVLGLSAEEVRDDDDFLDAGIDSLMLAELRNNVQKGLSKTVPIATFFANPTVASLTACVVKEYFLEDKSAREKKANEDASHVVVLNKSRGGANLFCIPGVGDNIFDFEDLAESGLERPICVLHACEYRDSTELNEITAIASRHLQAIRALQPVGPYSILGYSFGGSLAIEIANQLLTMGETVDSLMMLDSSPSFWHQQDPVYQRMAYFVLIDTLLESAGVAPDKVRKFYAEVAGKDISEVTDSFRKFIASQTNSDRGQAKNLDQVISVFTRRIHIDYKPPRRLGDIRINFIKATQGISALAKSVGIELSERFINPQSAYGWEDILSNRIVVTPLECSHLAVLRPPHINVVAAMIAQTDERYTKKPTRIRNAPV